MTRAGARKAERSAYLDALSFVLSALCIAGARVPSIITEAETTVAPVVEQLHGGLRIVRDTKVLRSLFLLFVLGFLVFGFMNALLLPFAMRALHAGTFAYGLIEGLPGLGFVPGSLLMAHLADRLHEGQWIAISAVGMAASRAGC